MNRYLACVVAGLAMVGSLLIGPASATAATSDTSRTDRCSTWKQYYKVKRKMKMKRVTRIMGYRGDFWHNYVGKKKIYQYRTYEYCGSDWPFTYYATIEFVKPKKKRAKPWRVIKKMKYY